MAYPVTFDRLIAGGVSSSKDGSNVPPATGYCVDFDGCSTPANPIFTHVKTAVQGQFNGRALCSSPKSIYGHSGKGIYLIDTDPFPQIPLPGAFDEPLHNYLAVSISLEAATMGAPPIIPPFAGFQATAWVVRGSSYIATSTDKSIVTVVSVPRTVRIVDPCDPTKFTYIKSSSSISVTIKNPVTCKPTLIYQASMSINAVNDAVYYPMTLGAIDGLFIQSGLSGLYGAISPLETAGACPALPAASFAIVSAQYPRPTTVTLGT